MSGTELTQDQRYLVKAANLVSKMIGDVQGCKFNPKNNHAYFCLTKENLSNASTIINLMQKAAELMDAQEAKEEVRRGEINELETQQPLEGDFDDEDEDDNDEEDDEDEEDDDEDDDEEDDEEVEGVQKVKN